MTQIRPLADRIEDLLPQTQCTKCGFAGCRPYAEAIANGTTSYNQCPPGGAEGIDRLASLLGKPVLPLNPDNGGERPRPVAVIDESLCIGCTLCLQACPVDAIAGAPKQMHTVIASLCTGCDLCVPPCPVDCIAMVPVTGTATGWAAWSQTQADAARQRYVQRQARLAQEKREHEARLAARAARAAAPSTSPADTVAPPADDAEARKKAIIQAALERARAQHEAMQNRGERAKNTDNVSAEVQAQIDEAEARRRRLGLHESPPKPRRRDR